VEMRKHFVMTTVIRIGIKPLTPVAHLLMVIEASWPRTNLVVPISTLLWRIPYKIGLVLTSCENIELPGGGI
jgi:hypothetical protein